MYQHKSQHIFIGKTLFFFCSPLMMLKLESNKTSKNANLFDWQMRSIRKTFFVHMKSIFVGGTRWKATTQHKLQAKWLLFFLKQKQSIKSYNSMLAKCTANFHFCLCFYFETEKTGLYLIVHFFRSEKSGIYSKWKVRERDKQRDREKYSKTFEHFTILFHFIYALFASPRPYLPDSMLIRRSSQFIVQQHIA